VISRRVFPEIDDEDAMTSPLPSEAYRVALTNNPIPLSLSGDLCRGITVLFGKTGLNIAFTHPEKEKRICIHVYV